MDTLKLITFLLISSLTAATAKLCSNAICNEGEPEIRFPFQLRGHQPDSCGFPGFSLSCDKAYQTILEIPGSGRFSVRSIDYGTQEIWVNDPSNCLPQRLLTLNLTGSPFSGVYSQEFTMFNCSLDFRPVRLNPVACMSGSTYEVFATSSKRAVEFLSKRCQKVATVPVPVESPFFEQVLSSDSSADLRLSWAEPRCGKCENQGGRCGFRSNSSVDIVCRDIPRPGLPKSGRYAAMVGAAVPALLFAVGAIIFMWNKVKSSAQRRSTFEEFLPEVSPPGTAAKVGLDEPTIESFPKVVLGESRRLPKAEDVMCSICLCEYKPKETLRSIPECQHCFHAGCIDEWLRLKATCPVCRTTPEPTPAA